MKGLVSTIDIRPQGSRHDAGTRIELNLKPEVAEEISDAKLVEITRSYVRHVEIPIKVVGSDGSETEVIDIGYDFKLAEVMEPFKLDKISDYELVETQIEPARSEGITGKIGTILKKTEDGSLLPVYWAWRDFKSAFGSFGINVSQKGIFVTSWMGRNSWYSEGWYGELNVEQSDEVKLRVSRDSFVLSKSKNIIDKVIQSGISELLQGLFEKEWNKLEKESICKITNQIIEGYIKTGGRFEGFLYMTTNIEKVITKNFMFRVVKDGKIGYSPLNDFLASIESWILVPVGSDIKESVIQKEAEAIQKDCGNRYLILAESTISPRSAFEFLVDFLRSKHFRRITTSITNRQSYYEYIKGGEPIVEDNISFLSYSQKVADFGSERQLIATHIGLEIYMNREHRFVRKLMTILKRMQGKDLELVKAFFSEVGECLNTTMGKVSREDLRGLIDKQKIVLDMLEEKKFILRQEKEELVLKSEELPQWRYE
jgi:hypothetical protein